MNIKRKGLHPVLQIVHITDLHVAEGHNPLHATRRSLRRTLSGIRDGDFMAWSEGTQGHLPHAPRRFATFLRNLKRSDRHWHTFPTWLVDTGDRTVYGDKPSLLRGREYIDMWVDALGGCQYRSLYGNHDAWPGTLPFFGQSVGSNESKQKVMQHGGWNVDDWVKTPLSAALPGDGFIDLYALDSVCWNPIRNTLAVGQVEQSQLKVLRDTLAANKRQQRAALRVLAMHHPLAFPWDPNETQVIPGGLKKMCLLDQQQLSHRLRNDQNDPAGIGPWVHLILSGHTHMAHPAHARARRSVVQIKQGLDERQLQLVGGPLMLNKSAAVAAAIDAPRVELRSHSEKVFHPSTVEHGYCQAQILRFYAHPSWKNRVKLLRIPVNSVDCGVTYDIDAGRVSTIDLSW